MIRDMPPMLRDILEKTIAGQADMRSIADTPSSAQPSGHVPDVVLVSAAGPGGESAHVTLLGRWPSARIVTIDVSGRQTAMYEMRPYRTELGALSSEELIDVIRAAARSNRPPHARPVATDGSRPH